jgi:hypothetical protein
MQYHCGSCKVRYSDPKGARDCCSGDRPDDPDDPAPKVISADGGKVLNLTSDEQVAAFEDAAEAVRTHVDRGEIDADTWAGSVTDGEVVRLLSEAYTGTLDPGGFEA